MDLLTLSFNHYKPKPKSMKILRILATLLLLIVGLSSVLEAQPQYYNYNTNGSNNSFPMGIAAGKEVQLLFTPGVFNQPSAAPAGNITSISFRIADTYPITNFVYTTFTISMGQAVLAAMPAGAYYTGTMTQVYNHASVTFNAAGGTWLTIPLDIPFAYNPAQSLIVDFGHCSSTNATGFPMCFTTLTPMVRNWSVGGCPFAYGGQNGAIYHMGINLTGGATTGTLAGTVTNSVTLLPIAGAVVSDGALNATTIANGTYTLANVPVGAQTATCTATNYVT